MLILLFLIQLTQAQSHLRSPASAHLLAETNPQIFEIKNATFGDCKREANKKKGTEKFNFLDQCITFASSNLKKGEDPRVCLATASLVDKNDVKILVKRCQSELGYDLCKVDTPVTDFRRRIDCIINNKDSMDIADCESDIQEIQNIMGPSNAKIKLSNSRSAVLEKDFCQKPTQDLPPSVKSANPLQQ